MHTNHTTNYELSQFVSADKPTFLGDYNGDMLKIDTAIAGVATTASGAVSTANAASATATDAATAAASAASTAATADANASSALATAGNAATAAAAAQSDATAASTAASAADTKATAADTKATAANTAIGDLTQLTTTEKTDLVAAINEVNAKPSGGGTAASTSYDNTTSGLTADNVQAAIDELAAGVHPEYSSDGLSCAAGVTITNGGYYIDANGVCHVDITLTNSASINMGDGIIAQFPKAATGGTSPYYFIGVQMNNLQMACNPNENVAVLKAYQNIGSAERRFVGSYQSTVTP